MKKLKLLLVSILESAARPKSVEAEADQILFQVARSLDPRIKKISDLTMLALSLGEDFETKIEPEAVRLAKARATGIPLQHLLGTQFFFEHEYKVSDAVLIPRPETEILIHTTISKIAGKCLKNSTFSFAELGLGSGILSCELLAHFPGASGVATEISSPAKQIAEKNLASVVGKDWASRLEILTPQNESQGFETLIGAAPYDVVISNPPYVSRNDEIELEVLKHEPALALFPPATESEDYFYENFILYHQKILRPGGMAFFEIPHERAERIEKMFFAANFSIVEIIPDLTGRPRVIFAGK